MFDRLIDKLFSLSFIKIGFDSDKSNLRQKKVCKSEVTQSKTPSGVSPAPFSRTLSTARQTEGEEDRFQNRFVRNCPGNAIETNANCL
jgi:hypothetical protein